MSMIYHPVLLWIRLVELYSLIIVVRAILSWFPDARRSKFYWFVYKITEPVLAPIRNMVPNLGIDISPILVVVILNIITRIIVRVFMY